MNVKDLAGTLEITPPPSALQPLPEVKRRWPRANLSQKYCRGAVSKSGVQNEVDMCHKFIVKAGRGERARGFG